MREFISDEQYFWSPLAARFNPAHPVTDAELQSLMKHLLKLKDLRYLNFDGSRTIDAGIAQLVSLADKLNTLDIRGTEVSDDGIASLKQLPRLNLLRLSDCKIYAESVDAIRKSSPNCKLERRSKALERI